MEFAALEMALDRDLPVLAICRGMQVLNVAPGGSLWQDLPSHRESRVEHRQEAGREVATHDVRVEAGSRLADVLGETSVATNSMHHQGIRVLGDGLRAVGWAEDGLVEGVEMAGRGFVLGVQWHPEELTGNYEHARRLFGAFVEAARA
jgi:putative glutamine amidotransferase